MLQLPVNFAACRPASPLPQLLAATGMDKGALEEELAAKEEEHLVAEFRRSLEYNLGKVGAGCLLVSHTRNAPGNAGPCVCRLLRPWRRHSVGGSRPGSAASALHTVRERTPPAAAAPTTALQHRPRPPPHPPPTHPHSLHRCCSHADGSQPEPRQPPQPPAQAARGGVEPAGAAAGQGESCHVLLFVCVGEVKPGQGCAHEGGL